jgi:hypothetical protein
VFFALLGIHWFALFCLYLGLALSLIATALYVRRGVQELRNAAARADPPKLSS